MDLEKPLHKFSNVVATTQLSSILSSLALGLEDVLNFKPQLEVMTSVDRTVLFRQDHTYYSVSETGQRLPYNPFAGEEVVGDVMCVQKPNLRYSKDHLRAVMAQNGFDYTYVANPLLFHLVADALTVMLNEDQLWVRLHRQPAEHFLQKYLTLEVIVHRMAPELTQALAEYHADVGSLQSDFNLTVDRTGRTQAQIISAYEARSSRYEDQVTQDFWNRQPMQVALRELTVVLYKAIQAMFPKAFKLAERSLYPAHGYDVFIAEATPDNQVVIKNLGDYRILFWEMTR